MELLSIEAAVGADGRTGARGAKGILEGAAFDRGIDAGLGDRAGGTQRVIVADSGRNSRDVWLNVHTGEEQLRRRSA